MRSAETAPKRIRTRAQKQLAALPNSSSDFYGGSKHLLLTSALGVVAIGADIQQDLGRAYQEDDWFPVATGVDLTTDVEGDDRHTAVSNRRFCAFDVSVTGPGRILWIGESTGHYYYPEAVLWRDLTNVSVTHPLRTTTGITWRSVSEAVTWENDPDIDERSLDSYFSDSVAARVGAITIAARGEHFESGYESTFRKQLAKLFRSYGTAVIDALCQNLRSPGVDTDVLAQGLRFLATVVDPVSLDARLVCIASFLRGPSAIVRDAAGTALEVLGDRRGASYLREAASREVHVMLKDEFLEIAAELEGD